MIHHTIHTKEENDTQYMIIESGFQDLALKMKVYIDLFPLTNMIYPIKLGGKEGQTALWRIDTASYICVSAHKKRSSGT
jgi:hypothetical protein